MHAHFLLVLPELLVRCAQSLSVTPTLVMELSRAHMDACIMYQNELGNALANANRDGEEARKQERMRIWGYC